MNQISMKTVALFVLSLFTFVGPLHASDDWSEHPEWSGDWKLAPAIAELLGFSESDEDSAPLKSLQIGFFVSKKATLDVLGKDTFESASGLIEKMGHRIVAAGRYKAITDKGKASCCFVTIKAGATYIWFGDQSKTASFAKVHFVRGMTSERDILILDFGGIFKQRLRAKKAASTLAASGYRRQSDQFNSK